MKRKNCFVILGTFALVLSMNLSGCGNQGDVPAQTTEVPTVSLEIPAESTAPAAPESTAPADSESTAPAAQTPTAEAEHSENSELNGYVKQIDSGSFVVNKNITLPPTDGLICMVSSDIKVTVTYTDSTKFIMRTVVNGGVNPEDSSDAPALADDLQKDRMVDLKGSGNDTEFAASEVIIYSFE